MQITDAVLRNLYNEMEPLFPAECYRDYSNHKFRIGSFVVAINANDKKLLDVGFLYADRKGLTIQEAKDWLISKVASENEWKNECEKERKIYNREGVRNKAIFTFIIAMIISFLAINNAPITFVLILKILLLLLVLQ